MLTREIPRDRWITFLDTFSKEHQGWIVTVEVLGSTIGAQEESGRLPLIGISADLKGRENGIDIMLGGRPDAHLTRIINRPRRLWFKQPEEEAHEALEVESEDGTVTVVHFRHVPPVQPERQLPAKA